VDPAISQAQDADSTAITVVGTDDQGVLYLLDLEAGKMLPEQMIDTVLTLHARWHFLVLGIETNAFQRMLSTELRQRLWQSMKRPNAPAPFRIEEFSGTSQQSKRQRILGLQPYHESGRLKFPGTSVETLTGDYRTLALQLQQFPHSHHDDLMDSLAYHVQVMQPGEVTVTAQDIPWNSPAGLERTARNNELVEMGQQPRWLRTPVDPLSFS
jgi:predicted phage terminase large subunit-like protein